MDVEELSDALYESGWRDTADAQHTGVTKLCHRINSERAAMRDALEWYAERAQEMRRHTLGLDTKLMMEAMKAFALDGGRRAREAINTQTQEKTE